MNSSSELERDGVSQIQQAVPAAVLAAYDAARPEFLRAVETRWCNGILSGTEAHNFFDEEDIGVAPALARFVESVDATLISQGHLKSHRLVAARIRLVAPFPLGYLNWHVDHDDGPGLFIKAVIYLNDVPRGTGEFGYVPRSHRKRYSGDEEMVARTRGYRLFPGRAGSAIAFDTAGIHGPAANLSDGLRETLILSFARW